MSFWRGFLDQWNYEEERAARESEKEEAFVLARKELDVKRQLSLLQLGATRDATSKDKVADMQDAMLWVQSMIPKGAEGREEYLTKVQRDPKTALILKAKFEAHQKAAGGKGQRPIAGEDFMSLFSIVQTNPELLEDKEALSDILSEASRSDLSDHDAYLGIMERIYKTKGSDVPTAVMTGDISIMDSAQEEGQKRVHDLAIEKLSKSYSKVFITNESLQEMVTNLGTTNEAALSEWNNLVESYLKEGNIEAGIIVSNTINLWDYMGKAASSSPTLNNWEKNAYFSPIYRETFSDNRTFDDYLKGLSRERLDQSRVK